MRRQKRIENVDWDSVGQRYLNGEHLKHLAEELCCNYRTIQSNLKERGIGKRTPLTMKEHQKRWRRKNPRYLEVSRKWKEKNPEKVKAHSICRNINIPRGTKCEVCKKRLAEEKHHPDYAKPKKL